MKKIFILLLVIPIFSFSQIKKKTEPHIQNGFVITGDVTGFPNGTAVSFLNDETGQPEQQTTIENAKFVIKGQMPQPSFKVLVFGNQPPAVPLFLDNSNIKISGDKNTIDKLSITGSPSHEQYKEYVNAIQPYLKIFGDDAVYDSNATNAVEKISSDFVKKHPASYVAPLAIIRLIQATQNGLKAEELYKLMAGPVQASQLGQYVNQQIQESKINAIGSVVKDFSQNDTSGKAVNFSSFRGKYVLLDFWASWCRPCRMENPNVVAAYNKFHDKNFTILSVSLDQAKPAWLNAIQMDGLTWNHVSDLKGWNNEVAGLFQIRSIPQNLLIDPQGKIIAKNLRGPLLENKLDQIFK
ncbi:AhpC/TSA family protein [Ginsengibacter hankyongi]|uniref:AhpC/TSA family protein n=1 Tax=Ginsengibacter hankyongi TaxID=2607284 RepID=A0A5J5IMG5_9BACT|nr:TlpA disulfide reductase family protein [Ginsengibacter hankyongi]KAA9041277.1 AhpC/TSA family protein [Ginsengibacter hankyongi]